MQIHSYHIVAEGTFEDLRTSHATVSDFLQHRKEYDPDHPFLQKISQLMVNHMNDELPSSEAIFIDDEYRLLRDALHFAAIHRAADERNRASARVAVGMKPTPETGQSAPVEETVPKIGIIPVNQWSNVYELLPDQSPEIYILEDEVV